MQAGITFNGGNPADRFNGPLLTNDRDSELQLNQLWLYLERPVDTRGGGFDIGGRVDAFFGTDWRVALVDGAGFEDRINGNGPDLYGISIPQFYVEMAYDRLSVKAGRMTSTLGYEGVPPMGNFFYSHSTQFCFGGPFLIAGVMGQYQMTDQLALKAGFHQGEGRFEDNNDELAFQGGVFWNSYNKKTALSYGIDIGSPDDAGQLTRYLHSIVFQLQLSDRLKYVAEGLIGNLDGAGIVDNAEWYGISQYLFYTINDCWSAGMRVEWFRDDDGTRVLGLGNLPGARGWAGTPGFAGHFADVSLGLNWKPKSNIFIRPEVRYDVYNGAPNPNAPYALPYDDGTSNNQFTLATDFVITF